MNLYSSGPQLHDVKEVHVIAASECEPASPSKQSPFKTMDYISGYDRLKDVVEVDKNLKSPRLLVIEHSKEILKEPQNALTYKKRFEQRSISPLDSITFPSQLSQGSTRSKTPLYEYSKTSTSPAKPQRTTA